jgi:O-antigen ligase
MMITDDAASGGDYNNARRNRAEALVAAMQAGTAFQTGVRFSAVTRYAFYTTLILSLLWPRYFYLRVPGLPGLSPFIIFGYASIGLLIYALAVDRAFAPFTRIVRVSVVAWTLFAIFVSWRLLCSALGAPIAGDVPIMIFFRQFPPLAIFFPLGAVLLMDEDVRRTSLRIILVAILVMALGGMVEVVTDTRLLPLLGLDRFAAGGVFVNEFTSNFYRDNSLRAQSTFTQPLVFGQFAAAFAPLCLSLIRHESWNWRVVAAAAFAACLYCVWLSTARSGLLALIVSLTTYAMLTLVSPARYRWLLLCGAMILLIILIWSAYQVGDLLAAAVGHTADNLNSAMARQSMIDMSFSRAHDSPFVGFGDGSARWLAGMMANRSDFATIDSLYLSILVQNGFPGIGLWFAFMAVVLLMAVRNALEGATGAIRDLNCAIAALVAAMTVGLSVLSIEDNMSFVYLMAGVVMIDRLTTRSAPGRLGRAIF